MIPLYPVPLPTPNTPAIGSAGKLAQVAYYLLRQLWRRTGGEGGLIDTVASNLTATGNSQATALPLSADYNEILSGAGGVALATLQLGQRQWIFNGTAAAVSVYPSVSGQIDTNAVNAPYALAAGKTQLFVCYELLATGGRLFRSLQLG